MKIIPWDPWDELARVRERTERIWDDFLQSITHDLDQNVAFVPSADIVESSGEYRFFIAVPGFVEEDIAITLDDHQLIVRGERLPQYDEERATNHVRELRYGYFERQFQLGQRIAPETLRASYESGMLVIVVAKFVENDVAQGGLKS